MEEQAHDSPNDQQSADACRFKRLARSLKPRPALGHRYRRVGGLKVIVVATNRSDVYDIGETT